jgi:integrase/transposase
LLLTTRTPTQVVIKSRGRIGGKRATFDEIENQIVKMALDGMQPSEIEKQTGKDRTTIWRYIKKAEKKGLIQRTDSNRIKLSKQVEAQQTHEFLERDLFRKKYPAVDSWIDRREKEAKGDKTKLRNVISQLGQLKVVCDTLGLNPYGLLAEKNGVLYGGLESAMLEFSQAIVKGQVKYRNKKNTKSTDDDDEPNVDSILRTYLMACRNFVAYNGITIPKLPKEHILSGKKVGFGQYAHIKMSWRQINQTFESLKQRYGESSRELNAFIFYYLTGTRKNSLWNVETKTVGRTLDGWMTCKVYESKTKKTWNKIIPSDNPHSKTLEAYIQKRIQKGCKYIFKDEGEALQKYSNGMNQTYAQVYREIGITDEYFFGHAIHALRHVSAHYWLERTNYNHVAVAKICGWTDVQTLISCYGEMTDEQIVSIVSKGDYKHAK